MRAIALVPSILLLVASGCAPSPEPSRGPAPTPVPSVFPPPEQLVDDRALTNLEGAVPPAAPAPNAPPSPTAPEERLAVYLDAGTLMYPRTMPPDGRMWINASHAVTADELERALSLVTAPTKEDLVAGRTRTLRFTVEAAGDAAKPMTSWLVTPAERFAIGHWYLLRVAGSLQGVAPAALGSELASYLRGPEPLAVTDVSCGWPVCTTEDRWTVSFNAEIDPASLRGCLSTRPALDLGTLEVQGWSVVFQPKNAEVGTEYRLSVGERCRSTNGDRLRAPHVAKVRVEPPRARLALPRGTGYLPPAASGKAPIVRVGAAHTGKLTIGTRRLTRETLPAFLAANLESWGGLSFSAAEAERTTELVPEGADGGDVSVPVPLAQALGGDRGVVYLRVEAERIGNDDEPPMRQALIQVTELGLSVKSGPEDTLVWVTSLLDQRPVPGVEVVALDTQGKAVWTRQTDERGMAVGPGRQDTTDGPGARVVMAARGEDLAFIDLAEYATRSEPYEFGLPHAWDARADALRGIVFTERGVYRSGERVHIKGFVRVDRGRKLEKVAAQSISVSVTNPLGDRALAAEVPLGSIGDFEVDLPLTSEAALGTWSIAAEVPSGANGNVGASFRVEAYRPNTFEVKVGEVARDGDHLKAVATGRYYYGAPMAEAGARWWVHRADASFSPAGYEGFVFEVPSWSDWHWEPEDTSVAVVASGDGALDAEGRLAIDADFSSIGPSLASGPQQLTLEVEVADVDQQVVTGRASLRVESADHYLGVRASTTFAGVGDTVDIDAIALSPEGRPVDKAPFELRWIRRTWQTRQITTAGGGLTWESTPVEEVLQRKQLESAATPVRTSFVPSAAGLYWIEVEGRDAKGRAMKARESVWVWGDGGSWAENDQGHVELVAAKEQWQVGDRARFVVQSPFATAHALITVETSGVIWKETRELVGSAPLVEIPVTQEMQPNAYVSVVLIGAPRQAGADAEVRLGYARLTVDTSDRRLAVEVEPDAAAHAPGERVRVKLRLRDAAGKPAAGQVTFMAVDEGVLSLTGYRTPDPHAAFFAERALAIVTSESRRQLWSRLVADDGMKSDWGGGGEGGEATNYRSAFATTAAFLPDVAVGVNGESEVSFELPDNLTTFRLMAVAASEDGRFGKGESKVEVRKPLIVRPGLPRFLSVGDSFDARAVVQALDPELAGSVAVTLSVSGPVQLAAKDRQEITAGARATPVSFAARATEPGTAVFAFEVKAPSGARDAVEVQIPVLWPAARRQAFVSGTVAATQGQAVTTLQIPDWVRDDIGGVDVTLTATRLGELLPGLEYLLEYPYGCVEQTTGGTLPLLALHELESGLSLPGITRDEILVRAQAGLDRIRSMQTWSGGIAYWPGQTTPHPWGSVYAGMALVRASRMEGLEVSPAVIERLTTYLKDILRDQAAATHDEWHSELEVVKPFAAYVLALAGTPEPAYHATLFDKRASLPDFGKLLLALAIDQAHGDRAMATTLLDEVLATVRVDGEVATLEREEDRYYYSTMDSDVRSMALLALALQAIRPEDAMLPKVQKGLLDARRSGRWMSTQDNAFALLALAKTFVATEHAKAAYTVRVEIDGQAWLEERMTGSDTTPRTLHLPMYAARKAHGKTLTITRSGDEAPLYFSMRFDYAPREIPVRALTRGIEIDRRYSIAAGARAGQPATEVSAGDLVKVDITVASAEVRRYVAVDDPLPAGLEPVTLDFATTRASLSSLTGAPAEPWQPSVFDHHEQRDDRVTLFSDILPAGRHTYTYLARATTAGQFVAPAARAHEMYHPDVHGQSAATEVTVR